MSEASTEGRELVFLEDLDERIVTKEDVSTTPIDVSVDEVLEAGVESYSEVELSRLPAATVADLQDCVSELSDEALGVLEEVAARGRFYGVFVRQPGSAGQAWYNLGMEILKEERERGYGRNETPMTVYTSVAGVPSSVGNVASRLLSGWVVEMEVVKADPGPNPESKRVVAEVDEEIRMSEDTGRWIGSLNDERAWRLEGRDDHDGEVFAMAPLNPGDDTTVWVEESFSGEWSEPWNPVSITAWPTYEEYENWMS